MNLMNSPFNLLFEIAMESNAVIANLNLTYQRHPESNRTSVALNGLPVAIIEREPGEVFKVQMLSISTNNTHVVGSVAVYEFLNSECSKWIFSCWK
jgi:hypothetical protein